MAEEDKEPEENRLRAGSRRAWAELRAGRLTDAMSRIFLALLTIAAIVFISVDAIGFDRCRVATVQWRPPNQSKRIRSGLSCRGLLGPFHHAA